MRKLDVRGPKCPIPIVKAKKAALTSQRTEKDETGREIYVHLLERLT